MNVNCAVQKNTNWKVVVKFCSMYVYSGDVNCTVQKNTNWKVVLKFRSMYMYSGDLMLLESQFIKTVSKNVYIFEIHKWISVSRDVHS